MFQKLRQSITMHVDAINLETMSDLEHTSIFDWCVIGCESKNEHQNDTKRLEDMFTNVTHSRHNTT